MDGIIFLPTFGQKSSSFFDRRLSVGSLDIVIAVLGAGVLLALLLLTAYSSSRITPLADEFAHIERISAATHEIAALRWQIERYLGTDADFAAAESGALNIQAAVERLTQLIDDYGVLDRLDEASTAYLNLLRSYHSVSASANSGETLTLLREQLDTAAEDLNRLATTIRTNSMIAAQASVQPLTQQMLILAALLLVGLLGLFAICLVFVSRINRHSARILGTIRQVTQQITDGHFDARINLTGEHDRDVMQLGQAFNHLADNLNLALQAEVAATEQNRLQLLKLARQERMTAVLEERQRIARELHDSVKQQLFSITLSAGAVLNLLHDAPPLARTHLEHIKQASHSAQSEMTILLQELVSVPLQDRRLEDALLDYLNPLCQTHSLKLLWRTDGTNTLSIAQEHALFRAVQEAVANVVRHSGATVLRVSLRYGLITQVVVEDNGSGFKLDSIAPTSNGLAMMRTRLKRVGGRCELHSEPGTGTRLTIHLDLRRR